MNAAKSFLYFKIFVKNSELCYNVKNNHFLEFSGIQMNCKVTISGAEGENVTSFGDLSYSKNGFCLAYKIAGDSCVLSVCGGTVTQSRRGSVNTDITFSKGKNTICMLLSGELTGSIPVKTVDLYAVKTDSGAIVKIVYFLGGVKINLNLSAVIQ